MAKEIQGGLYRTNLCALDCSALLAKRVAALLVILGDFVKGRL